MAIKSGFFNSVNGDRKYDAKSFAEYFASFIGNGIFPNPSTNLQVISNNNMTVTVKAGRAWINGYILINDDDYILAIDPADGVLNRIDRIILRYDVVDREIRIEVKKGTFASSPTTPILQRDANAYELGLADILVSKGIISITQANITDLRLNTELCGIVHGIIDQIDITTLYNQYTEGFQLKQQEFEQEFNTWLATIQDALDGDTAGNLLSMINDLTENKVNKELGKGLSTNDYTTVEKDKLAGIAVNANNYSHPSTHPATIITESTNKRFMTDTERTKLSGIEIGAQVNRAIATRSQAQAGIVNTVDMTPLRTAEAIQELTPGYRLLHEITVNADTMLINIPIPSDVSLLKIIISELYTLKNSNTTGSIYVRVNNDEERVYTDRTDLGNYALGSSWTIGDIVHIDTNVRRNAIIIEINNTHPIGMSASRITSRTSTPVVTTLGSYGGTYTKIDSIQLSTTGLNLIRTGAKIKVWGVR